MHTHLNLLKRMEVKMDFAKQVLTHIQQIAERAIRDYIREEVEPERGSIKINSLSSEELASYIIGFVQLQRIGNMSQLDDKLIYEICIKRLERKECSLDCIDYLSDSCDGVDAPDVMLDCVTIGLLKSCGQFVIDPSATDDDHGNEDFHEVLNV